MKKALSLLLCVCFLISLCACGNDHSSYLPTGNALTGEGETGPTSPGDGEDKLITLTYYPNLGLNPYSCVEYTNRALMSLLYQGLFSVDASYSVEPLLCGSYALSTDMRTHTFTVAEGATFSDGTPVTAQDVVDSLLAAKSSKLYSGRMLHITSATLSQEGAVVLRTDTAYENLAILLDIPIVKGSQVQEAYPTGSGPYALENSTGGAFLKRRSDWWCRAELPITTSAIPLIAATSITQIRDNFQFSGLSFAFADPSSDRYVDYRCDFELWNCESGVFLYLGCNEDSAVFTTPALRAALTYGIDRTGLVSKFYRGFASAATLPASPASPYYNKALAGKYDYNPTAFKDAVHAAGKEGSPIVFLVNSDDSLRVRVARSIAQMLQDGGLIVEMKELGGSNYTNAVKRREFDLYLGQTRLSPNMDLSAFFHVKGALSYGGLDNVAAYSLCLESLANQGNYYTLHRTIMEQGLLCPILFCDYAVYTTRGAFTSLNPARDNPFYYSLGKALKDVLIK